MSEKTVPRIIDRNREVCPVMTYGYPTGRIFISHPHINNGNKVCFIIISPQGVQWGFPRGSNIFQEGPIFFPGGRGVQLLIPMESWKPIELVIFHGATGTPCPLSGSVHAIDVFVHV